MGQLLQLTLQALRARRYKPHTKEPVCVFRYFSLITWLQHMTNIASIAKAMQDYGGPKMVSPAGEQCTSGTFYMCCGCAEAAALQLVMPPLHAVVDHCMLLTATTANMGCL
jgi:tRNA C32,U32 (ribose-2'-O)-methylase TrmJ